MLYWISVLGVLLITFEQIVDRRSSNMCIQSLNLDKDSVGVTTDRRSTNTRMNLIYLTDFSARNERQQLGYERMMLLSIRAKVNMVRIYRQLKPNVVRTIQQLRIQKRRGRGKKGGKAKTANVKILSTRFINFSNLGWSLLKNGVKWRILTDAGLNLVLVMFNH